MAIVINGTGTVTGISVGGLPDAIVDLDTLAANSVNAAKIVDGTVVVGDIADDAISAAKLANSINTDIATGVAALSRAGGTMTGEVVLDEITETEATSAATTYTVALANGTIFDLTSGSTCTVTMPAFEAGKSFTVIATVPAAWAGSPAIIWSGGAAPTTGSGRTIYSFVSDGARWYGMQAGTGFA